MVSRKVLSIDSAITFVVVVLVLVPSVLLNPPKFKDTFKEKCSQFKEKEEICERAWVLFEQAYVGKDPKTVTPDNYKELFDEFPFTYPCEKTMLWSKTSDLVKLVGKECYFPIGRTLLGHVLDGLFWCGKENSPETFTDFSECTKPKINPYESFWTMAAIRYAQHACKEVKALLNGDVEDPYDTKSFLAESEVPYLDHTKVTKLDVILAVKTKGRPGCNDKSLKDLKSELRKKGIGYDCKEVFRAQLEKCKHEKSADEVCKCQELLKM
ncbi:ADP-ribosyl cyclase/cyclic ADP-ribose hydrolase 1-like isoform X2 [Labrus mixtus]|uniref:ADP-ribosyl cyclase/cyclic ADP-ribose hydrolase 1-like isoform X2 n=1 Tax=Labrus mixtus TaxID=508554 RepID=UPI0029C02BEF|nr:ADP-ribosyl cyclase/cyclic ADP-ribose hydrolase 1-like isoform X2 [Labrus mixtus]